MLANELPAQCIFDLINEANSRNTPNFIQDALQNISVIKKIRDIVKHNSRINYYFNRLYLQDLMELDTIFNGKEKSIFDILLTILEYTGYSRKKLQNIITLVVTQKEEPKVRSFIFYCYTIENFFTRGRKLVKEWCRDQTAVVRQPVVQSAPIGRATLFRADEQARINRADDSINDESSHGNTPR